MTDSLTFIKRQYFDSRLGMAVIGPIMAITNTILLVYNFTALQNILPLRYFAPIFFVFFIISVVIIGRIFRLHQQHIDTAQIFDQDKKTRAIELVILKTLYEMKPSVELKFWIKELERIVK